MRFERSTFLCFLGATLLLYFFFSQQQDHLRDVEPGMCLNLADLKIEPLVGLLRSPQWEAGIQGVSVEDRSYIKMLPSFVNVEKVWQGKRKVLYDLGLNKFDSSIGWMRRNYGVTFDAIYGWEVDTKIFQLPPASQIIAGLNFGSEEAAQRFLDTIHYEYKRADLTDSDSSRDIAKFIQSTSSPEDFVVLKMDIEGGEWALLPHLIKQGVLPSYVDELFVELHFAHPRLASWGWNKFRPHTLEDARAMMERLRELGVFAHYWP